MLCVDCTHLKVDTNNKKINYNAIKDSYALRTRFDELT